MSKYLVKLRKEFEEALESALKDAEGKGMKEEKLIEAFFESLVDDMVAMGYLSKAGEENFEVTRIDEAFSQCV